MKKILWKDILKSISKSKGRFFSIMGLMLIGSFALVGLKVTGPNMRSTGENYFDKLNTTDLTIIGTLGIDNNNIEQIDKTKDIKSIEYGYLKDVVIKDTTKSIRVFSQGNKISDYELVSGKLPEKSNEIGLDNSYSDKYKIGDTIEFKEKEDVSGETVLKEHKFKVVGFVYSSEILSSINQGVSTAGTGSLNGYAIVPDNTFDSDIYMLARMTFRDLEDVDPYSDKYTDLLQNHKDELDGLLKDQPEIRLAAVKKDYQNQIDEEQDKIDEAKKELSDAQNQLEDAKGELKNGSNKIKDAQNELDSKVADANVQITDGASQIVDAQSTIDEGEKKLASANNQLRSGKSTLNDKWSQLQSAKQQLDQARLILNKANEQLSVSANSLNDGRKQIVAGYEQISESETERGNSL